MLEHTLGNRAFTVVGIILLFFLCLGLCLLSITLITSGQSHPTVYWESTPLIFMPDFSRGRAFI